MSGIYHAGELGVQSQAGVQELAQDVEGAIRTTVWPAARQFILQQPIVFVGAVDAEEGVWASALVGLPGFMVAVNEKTLHIGAVPAMSDPLSDNLKMDPDVGLLIMDFATRRRLRLNGRAELQPDGGFNVYVQQVYGNCPKYIQARNIDVTKAALSNESDVRRSNQLTPQQQQWISQADTFFVASAHPNAGADMSHRGGDHGFVTLQSTNELTWPDYVGNNMFNTLGNIAINPKVGLLFLDFETGGTLQLAGQARIIWDETEISQYIGAERLVSYQISQILETPKALPVNWSFLEHSPFNP